MRIELDGMFGTYGHACLCPGFSAHAVEFDRPFLSQTGYRCFLGIQADVRRGLTPDAFMHDVIAAYVAHDLKGKLVAIEPRYRDKGAPSRPYLPCCAIQTLASSPHCLPLPLRRRPQHRLRRAHVIASSLSPAPADGSRPSGSSVILPRGSPSPSLSSEPGRA